MALALTPISAGLSPQKISDVELIRQALAKKETQQLVQQLMNRSVTEGMPEMPAHITTPPETITDPLGNVVPNPNYTKPPIQVQYEEALRRWKGNKVPDALGELMKERASDVITPGEKPLLEAPKPPKPKRVIGYRGMLNEPIYEPDPEIYSTKESDKEGSEAEVGGKVAPTKKTSRLESKLRERK